MGVICVYRYAYKVHIFPKEVIFAGEPGITYSLEK